MDPMVLPASDLIETGEPATEIIAGPARQ